MKLRKTFVALLALVTVLTGGAAVAGPVGGGGPGTDTSYHDKHLFTNGNPTLSSEHQCQSRLAGPYPSGDKVVAKFRTECRDKSWLMSTTFVDRLKNLDAGYGKSLQTSQSRCLGSSSTRRVASNGVVWWGCSHRLVVTDRRPVKNQYWQANLYMVHELVSPDGGSVDFESVITWCRNHQSYCNHHTGAVASRYWFG